MAAASRRRGEDEVPINVLFFPADLGGREFQPALAAVLRGDPNKGKGKAVRPVTSGAGAEGGPRRVGETVLEIRHATGLSYEMLGHMFGVSRRTVHNWALGKSTTAAKMALVMKMHDAIKHIWRGRQEDTRAELLTVVPDFGMSRLELLRERKFMDATKGLRIFRREGTTEGQDTRPNQPRRGMDPGDGTGTFIDYGLTPVRKRAEVRAVTAGQRPEAPVGSVRRQPRSGTWKKRSE